MKYSLPFLILPLALTLPARAQGVSAPWDISQTLTSLAVQAQRLTPILDQLTPEKWQAKGAPAAYTAQWRNARSEVGYLLAAVESTKKQPEKLSLALETLFRLQAVEAQADSLVEGVRKYQNPAVGELLMSVVSANSANRDQLRQYITDLAQTKEQEFQVVDREAQRCRDALMRQPPPRPATAPKPAPAAPAQNTK
ncbi:MAG: hypothetical protein ABI833_00495 [Acidobacteriota bacterium]